MSLSAGLVNAEPIRVFVAPVKSETLQNRIEALGTLRANESVELKSAVTEFVTRVNFNDGERVKAGQLLVQMDSREEYALLEEERSRLAEAQRQVERLRPLVERGAASDSLLDERQRDVQTAKARLSALQSGIALRKIVAPFDGVVGFRNISVGALTQPGQVITTLDDDSRMKLDFNVPEIHLQYLQPGNRVEARARAFPEQRFEGRVSSVDSRVDPVTRSVTVRAIINNNNHQLRPGQLMSVTLQQNPHQTLIIPEAAIFNRGRTHQVMVIPQVEGPQTAEQRQIQISNRADGRAEITSGLNEGEFVITHGLIRTKDGDEVLVKAVDQGNSPLTELLAQNLNASSDDHQEKAP
ncbi:MAG: efflux RND transporter periplasmic adaptor subunit [Oceanobacter sp.]